MLTEIDTLGKESPLVTVVIPAYNCEKFLPDCLKSVASQSYQNLEIIVIDDQSTDNTGRIADCFAEKDQRFIVIHKVNEGPGAARNQGLRMAKGKYLQFVDADDLLSPDAISTTVGLAERYNVPIINFNFSLFRGEQVVGRSGAIPEAYPKLVRSSGIECLEQIYTGHLGYFSWAFLYRIEDVRKCNMHYPTDIHLLEDMLMFNHLLRHNLEVVYCNRQLYSYRIVENSLSHHLSSDYVVQGLQVVKSVREMCINDGTIDIFVPSEISLLLYLDSLLPSNDNYHKSIRREISSLVSLKVMKKLDRKTALKICLTKLGLMNLVRNIKHI